MRSALVALAIAAAVVSTSAQAIWIAAGQDPVGLNFDFTGFTPPAPHGALGVSLNITPGFADMVTAAWYDGLNGTGDFLGNDLFPYYAGAYDGTFSVVLGTLGGAGDVDYAIRGMGFDPRADQTRSFTEFSRGTAFVPGRTSVSEPTSLALLALGGIGLVGVLIARLLARLRARRRARRRAWRRA
jgi:hypothetical protein